MLVVAALAAGSLGTSAEAAEQRAKSRFSLVGQKYLAPQTRMSEAGVAWSINHRVSLELNYERTGYGPTMSFDHDNGILTALKIGF
jgi:hypothetical protein